MAAKKDRSNIDRSRLELIAPMSDQTAPSIIAQPMPSAISSFMNSSLPPRAAALDQFTRQFYGRTVPQRRILTPNIF